MNTKLLDSQDEMDDILELILVQLALAGDNKEAIIKALDNAGKAIETILSDRSKKD